MKTVLLDSQKSLVEWVSQATGINSLGVKVRLRGNDLHILCEGSEFPERWRTLSDLLHALQQTDLDILTSNEQPSIYQVFVYGRKKGEYRPKWCHRVYLNQVERHLEQVEQVLEDSEKSASVGGSLILSNESLARRGDPNAIARYLSETLSPLGVSVQVKTKQHQPKDSNQAVVNRLWIFCQSSYSPDSSLLAEPVAQQLRDLKLVGYQDAVIVSQVSGEIASDWMLRVDLRPPEMMLKEWARWGDVQAITRLLRSILSELKVAVQVSLKESTLHIFCTPAVDPSKTAPAPDKALCLEIILRHLEAIAPQGILAATVYGKKTSDQQPAWIDWLSLPATEHPALATLPLELASDGDQPAITFLLERLLNLDLDWRLKTGGIRVLLLRKGDLLHIMCDAPICPARSQVAHKVTQFLQQLKMPSIAGVRVYGRRAGNKEPSWQDGVDLVPRQRLVPEATPEFAATAEYVNELLIGTNSINHVSTNEPILRHDLTSEEVQNFVTEVARDWTTSAITTAKKWLIGTQIFTESGQSVIQNPDSQGLKVALVWGTLGLLLTLQTDWILGHIITRSRLSSPQVTSVSPSLLPGQEPSSSSQANQNQKPGFLNSRSGKQSPQSQKDVFNDSGFTQGDDGQERILKAGPLKERANAAAILLAARSQIPSFNSRQLNEQLALYKQRVAKNGKAADVLIIGSSRALRGIDPVVLSQSLANQGYPHIDVFNFGINGATAQIVNLIIRQVLEPSELPKLILWADGSRAFNSNREDITFKAIAASEGYKQVLQKAFTAANSDESPQNSDNAAVQTQVGKNPNINSYQVVNESLNQVLSGISISHQNREQVKAILQEKLLSLPLVRHTQAMGSQTQFNSDNSELDTTQQAVDFDGFLALSVRFNPIIHYQKHPRVAGNYDNDYRDFQIAGEQDAAFQEILQFTQTRNISLVFVNMPLTSDYLDPVRTKYEQEFQQHMLSLSTNPKFIYRDLSQLWPKTNDYFSDPSHLNRFGAYEVSKRLANDPMIAWPTK
ncbi:DUF1574 domain-containing protein [Nodularia sphaerocarpa]|uniref:DUF1574 domain-containing protein n=1 Tax=Nodularia sphaerocarpa TaxID=137816 RepID=UPI001EFA4DA6|nr:DUF1574 domain-containing protein [Nodularia sphaerocarpa]MDB9374057.1 DUF1574 domain-containing protein [Nodularia sphaerocarpa CS-585]MDB9376437.1 DUF1574 domain-containing protein [Nodularia sphaerocarpa CS-585A2]ULP71300.1 hypothetical protein BDGGKGIB_00926 [Nodularia sphaerocarpa UHCC 0038]